MTLMIPCDQCVHGRPFTNKDECAACDHNKRQNERAEHMMDPRFRFCRNIELSNDCHYADSLSEMCSYPDFPECYLSDEPVPGIYTKCTKG